ncbi:MAG: hypothetical protein GWN62_20600, partial [Aliifodinibius sp.]|nr:hypothetical protein [Fodinibius sp.]
GRIVNALETAKECKEADDDIQIIFDGAGTKWVTELSNPEHYVHPLYSAVQDKIGGACDYCAGAFGVKEAIKKTEVKLLDEYDQHPSLKKLIDQGYQLVTF